MYNTEGFIASSIYELNENIKEFIRKNECIIINIALSSAYSPSGIHHYAILIVFCIIIKKIIFI